MLSGYLLSVHSLLTILLSSIWTPLIMMFFRRAIYGRGLKNEIFTAILIAISFLGGGIEIVYGNFFVLFIMVIFPPFAHSAPLHGVIPAEAGIQKNTGFQVLPGMAKCIGLMSPCINRMRSLAVVSILFLFLSAIQLFPFIELFHHSVRGNGISYQEATTWSFAPKDILLFFLPDAYGYFLDMKKYWTVQCWFKTLYAGGLPFILSLIFFLMPYRYTLSSEEKDRTEAHQNNKMLFLVLMFYSIFLSLGAYNPLYPFVFKYIPFFNGIRYPAKFLHIFILVLSITAGLGFQKVVEFSEKRRGNNLKNILMISSLVSGLLLLTLILAHREIEPFLKLRGIDYPQFNFLGVNLYHAKRFFFWLALFFLLIRVGLEKKWKSWTKFLLVAFLIIDLFGNMGYFSREKTQDYFEKTKSLEIISSDKENGRVLSTAKTISQETTILIGEPTSLNILKEKNPPSMNLLFQLHDIWGVDVIRVKRAEDLYKAFTNAPSITATHLIDLYGVKYVTSITLLNEKSKFELIYARIEGLEGKRKNLLKKNTIKLYKSRNPLPRAWLVKDFKVMDSGTILSRMTGKDFHPDKDVLLEEEPKWINPSSPPFNSPIARFVKGEEATQNQDGHRGPLLRGTNDPGEPLIGLSQNVQILSESNNRLDLQVNAVENSLLVLSDTYYPGWKAFVDGKETKIYRADYTFRGIAVSAGTHQVEFVYDPLSFKLGALFTFLGIVGCVGLCLFRKNHS